MAKKLASDVEVLGHRAQTDAPEREYRYVYGGSLHTAAHGYVTRPNKKVVGRRASTFNLILMIFAAGVAIVAYISNIIAVNRLASEVNHLQTRYDKVSNANAALKAEINRKSSWDRIGKVATEQVGLRYPKEQPTMIEMNEELTNKAMKK